MKKFNVIDKNSPLIGEWADPLIERYQLLPKVDNWLEEMTEFYYREITPSQQNLPSVLFLTFDYDYELQSDRRILQQVCVWQKKGFQVSLACMTDNTRKDSYHLNTVVGEITLYRYSLANIDTQVDSSPLFKEIKQIFQESQPDELKFLMDLDQNPFFPFAALINIGTNLSSHDAVVACDLLTLPSALILSKFYSCPLLYDSHELYPEQIFFSKAKQFFLHLLEKSLLPKANIAYTISEQMAKLFMLSYAPPKQVRFFTNAPEFNKNKVMVRNVLRKKINVDEDKVILLCHGGISIYRNLEILILAYSLTSKNNDTCLVLMGNGDKKFVEYLINITARDDIFLLDSVSQNELSDWVNDADCIIIPYPACDHNTRNCTPNKLFDSLLLSKPLVVNRDLDVLAEIICQYEIGYTIRTDNVFNMSEDLSKVVNLLRKSNNKVIPLPGFKNAIKELGWEAQAQKLSQWIDELKSFQIDKYEPKSESESESESEIRYESEFMAKLRSCKRKCILKAKEKRKKNIFYNIASKILKFFSSAYLILSLKFKKLGQSL